MGAVSAKPRNIIIGSLRGIGVAPSPHHGSLSRNEGGAKLEYEREKWHFCRKVAVSTISKASRPVGPYLGIHA